MRKSVNSNVLNVMKHEQKKKYLHNRDIFIDCEGALNAAKGLCRASNSFCLQGYIQKIDLWPFSILFTSDIQVKINYSISIIIFPESCVIYDQNW